jgi:hypothetical protein
LFRRQLVLFVFSLYFPIEVIPDFDDDQHVIMVKANDQISVVVVPVVVDEYKLFVDQLHSDWFDQVVVVHDVFLLLTN